MEEDFAGAKQTVLDLFFVGFIIWLFGAQVYFCFGLAGTSFLCIIDTQKIITYLKSCVQQLKIFHSIIFFCIMIIFWPTIFYRYLTWRWRNSNETE